MPFIHVFGSSHANPRHGLPSILKKRYEIVPDSTFREKYRIGEVFGFSGGRVGNPAVSNTFVSKATGHADMPDYNGQVICLLIGTNDWARDTCSAADLETSIKTLVDRLLKVPRTAVILTGLLPRAANKGPRRTDMTEGTQVVRKLATTYIREEKMVRFVACHQVLLNPGTGHTEDGVKEDESKLKDGVHLRPDAVVLLADKLLEVVRTLPKTFFPAKNSK